MPLAVPPLLSVESGGLAIANGLYVLDSVFTNDRPTWSHPGDVLAHPGGCGCRVWFAPNSTGFSQQFGGWGITCRHHHRYLSHCHLALPTLCTARPWKVRRGVIGGGVHPVPLLQAAPPGTATPAAYKRVCRAPKNQTRVRADSPWRGGFVNTFIRPSGAAEVALPAGGASIDKMRRAHLAAAYAVSTASALGRGESVSVGDSCAHLHLEFGVREGRMINYLSSVIAPNATWHGFDSFKGLPYDTRNGVAGATRPRTWRWGDYAVAMPKVGSRVRLHAGWFNESLPAFLDACSVVEGDDRSRPSPRAAFVHMDADLYSSTVDVLLILNKYQLLRPGTVIAFDELFGHPSVSFQEWLALRHAAKRGPFRWRFITWMLHPESKYGRTAIVITE